MAGIQMDGTVLWAVIIAIATGTFLMRLSFIVMFGYLSTIPSRIEIALDLVPAAVLTALVIPPVLLTNGSLSISLDNARLPAALVATGVAWRTENMILTLGAGMSVLWALRFLV